jgi:hypothetical protein
MGLSDLVAKILLEVKSDTSQAKADLKSLKGAQKEVFQSQIDGVEAGNKALDKWVGRLGQAAVVLGAVKVAMESVEEYGRKLDLQAASAGVSIEGLRNASMGLKTEMELLEHAARMNQSAFKLTQSQMETAERAMYVLEERGNSSKEVWSAIDAALTKGAIKPLEQFGIVIDKTGMQLDENGLKLDTYGQKQEALRRVMEALSKTAKDAEGAQHDAADAMQVEIVKLQDFWHDMKMQLAQLVVQMQPVLTGLAESVKLVGELVHAIPDWMRQGLLGQISKLPGGVSKALTSGPVGMAYDQLQTHSNPAATAVANSFADARFRQTYGLDKIAAMAQGGGGGISLEVGEIVVTNGKSKRGSGGLNPGGYDKLNIGRDTAGPMLGFSTAIGSAADYRQYDSFGFEDTGGAFIKAEGERLSAEELERTKQLTEDWAANLEKYRQQEKSLLESMIGPVSEFDVYAEGFKMLGETMQVAGGAWSNALKEIGTSTDSLGKIAKKAFASIVQGIGEKLAAQSASHLVEALANTVLLNPVEAGKHYAAAGIYGAGAIAAFATAKSMGAGGGAQPAKPSGGAAASGAGGGTGYAGDPNARFVKQEQPKIFVIGQSFGRSSVRERAREARETVSYAMGYVGGEDS